MMIFENKISWNTVITACMIVVGGLLTFAEIRTQNALQDARIASNQQILQNAIENERAARKEALAEIRARADAERFEMRQQFSKLNDKIDELIKQQAK